MTVTESTPDDVTQTPSPRAERRDPVDTRAENGSSLVEDELLVEEISIDGMCGVY